LQSHISLLGFFQPMRVTIVMGGPLFTIGVITAFPPRTE
jgi:hypothetical protein